MSYVLPPADFRSITFDHLHDQRQFDFFAGLNHPHFGLVANVDVAPLQAFAKTHRATFSQCVVYAVSRSANAVPHLRRRIRDDSVIEHSAVHPSYAIDTAAAEGFSFCTVPFGATLDSFADEAAAMELALQTAPSFSDEPGRDDFLFLSAIPWVHFTGIQHAMNYHPGDCIPRISWGKVLPQGDAALMPVSIQAHHALVDGRALGEFYRVLAHLLSAPAELATFAP